MQGFYTGLVMAVFMGSFAFGAEEASRFEANGAAVLGGDFIFKPTSREGEVSFLVRKLEAGLLANVDKQGQFELKFTSADERTPKAETKKFLVLLEKAQLGLFSSVGTFSMGLVGHPWSDRQSKYIDFEFWGDSSKPMSARFKYIGDSDLGLTWKREFDNGGQVQLAALNGEENRKDEEGARKDLMLVWDQPIANGGIGLGVSYGGYDGYSPASEKVRILARGHAPWGRTRFGFEALWAQDSADAATTLSLAEGVQLSSDLPGQRTTAVGESLWWLYELSDREKIFFRLDDLNPSREIPEKGLRVYQAAYSFQYSDSVILALFYDQLEKQAKHSTSSPKSEKAGVTAKVSF